MMQNSSQSITVLLSSAAEDGDWDLVKDVISHGDVTATEVTQSFLLQKLASATGISQHLVKNILKNIFSNRSTSDTLKYVAEEAVVRAAHCDKWDILISFLSLGDILLEDDTNLLLVTELMASSEYLRKSYYLQTDVFICVWKHAKQKILDSTDKRVQNTLVQLAAELNMWSRVCDLLAAKPDLNLLDRDGLSVLHRLVMCPDNRFDSLLPVLLEKGADVSIKNSEGDTALHLAASCQNIGSVGKSLHLGDCNGGEQSTDFWSKIMEEYHLKCSESKQQALKTLVESCEDLDKRDSLGNTAMILAAKNKNWEFVKLLIEHGASTDLVDDNWRSVLHVLALTGGQMDPLLVTKIVEQCKSQINDTDLNGSSPLHLAVCSQSWTVFKVLLDLGGETGRRDGSGYTVLHTLAGTGRDQVQHVTSLFTLLTKQGVDLNIPCPAGNTVLHIAAMQRNWTLVKHLMHSGVDAERCNAEGFSLHSSLKVLERDPSFEYDTDDEYYFYDSDDEETDEEINTDVDELGNNDLIQTHQEFRQTSATPLEIPVLLNSAVEAGNWSLVRQLISNDDVSADVVSQSFLLQKLAIATVTSNQIIQDILNKLFSKNRCTSELNNIAQDAVVEAAKCSNWITFLTFLSVPNIRLEDETKLLSVIEMVEKSQILREKPCLQIDVLSAVWRYSRQTILECKDKKILNIFVGLVAELDMWSRVCDLLASKPDLNRLDRDGLSVLHRLVMCPDSRFDSFLVLLLENGANINNKTLKGDTILHLAAKHQKVLTMDQPSPPIYSGRWYDNEYRRLKIIAEDVNKRAEPKRQLLTRLIRSCESLDDCDDQGNTAVMLAAKNINWEFLKLLLANGARASHVDLHQRSLLHVLALYGSYMDPVTCQDLDLVTLCVNRGAEVNCVDCDGNSALHLAVQSKNWILCDTQASETEKTPVRSDRDEKVMDMC
ncbi:hypothetical protein C0Q70_11974 [Pomacea canaliculata]|uniref:Uncharacterized protein n=1 Tax=Pomacea canaliculata TaxID=400727 RepID=A0A2T7P075_POMCA|nr:hypothetical protein C0Q70_11974 [Pomacea canaliculata]